jgi:hypothetical protein
VGHRAPSTEARYLAAVLACGDHAALSGFAAAHLFGLVKGGPPVPEVTTLDDRRIRGVLTHRARQLHPRDLTTYRGIAITNVGRTIVDVAGRLSSQALARACHEAAIKHGVKRAGIAAALMRRPNAAGAAKLRAIFDGATPLLLSKLESTFLSQLKRARLPLPETNRRAGARYVDCRWRQRRLSVELDSYAYHHTRHAWELDRRREREAYARGDEFRRYTYGDVCEDPGPMLTELRALLGAIAVREHPAHALVDREQRHRGDHRDHEAAQVGVVRVADAEQLGGDQPAHQ